MCGRAKREFRIHALVFVFLDRDLAVGLFIDPVMGINVLSVDMDALNRARGGGIVVALVLASWSAMARRLVGDWHSRGVSIWRAAVLEPGLLSLPICLRQRVGCGECTACLVKEDCGVCSICCLQLPNDVASGLFCKCEQRRCLRIVEKVSPVTWSGCRLTSVPGLRSPYSRHHTSGLPTEPRVWCVSGLSDPRGLWPLPHLPSLSPPWSQAPVEVFATALFLGESG